MLNSIYEFQLLISYMQNLFNERFNGTLRREILNAEWFSNVKQAQIVINT